MSTTKTNITMAASIGEYGGKYITTTDATTPDTGNDFFAILATSDCVVNAVVGNIDVSGLTIYAGNMIYGKWSNITLTSGSCIAYQKIR